MFTFILSTLLALAFGQTVDSSPWQWSGSNSLYKGRFSKGTRSWDRLDAEVQAEVKAGGRVYARPEYAINPALVPADSRGAAECVVSSAARGRLMFAADEMAVVSLSSGVSGCPEAFNLEQGARNMVFVNLKDVSHLAAAENSETEAAAPSPRCENCVRNEVLEIFRKSESSMIETLEKTTEEIEAYMACYPTKHQAEYNRYYRKLIDVAGSVFRVAYDPQAKQSLRTIPRGAEVAEEGKPLPFVINANPVLMKCVGLRESRWDRYQPSHTGAMGIGQQVSGNVADMKCWLKGCSKLEERVVDGEKKKIWVKYQPWPWVQELWAQYFTEARGHFSTEEWKWLTTHPGTGKPCTQTMEDKARDAACPINSIAAMAVYQLVLEWQLRRASKAYHDNETEDMGFTERFHLAQAGALGHNGGIGSAYRSAKKSADPSTWSRTMAQLPKNAARVKELQDYRRLLKNCLERDNWKPIGDKDPVRECKKP